MEPWRAASTVAELGVLTLSWLHKQGAAHGPLRLKAIRTTVESVGLSTGTFFGR